MSNDDLIALIQSKTIITMSKLSLPIQFEFIILIPLIKVSTSVVKFIKDCMTMAPFRLSLTQSVMQLPIFPGLLNNLTLKKINIQ